MWSIGVILYVVLSGTAPFRQSTLSQKIPTASYEPMQGRRWDKVSTEAKDLIRKLLVVSPDQRPSATQVAEDPWFALGTPPRPLKRAAPEASLEGDQTDEDLRHRSKLLKQSSLAG